MPTIPPHRALESENWDRMTDGILNSALTGLLPFLQHHSGPTLAKALLERLHTHLQTELVYIRTGKSLMGSACTPQPKPSGRSSLQWEV